VVNANVQTVDAIIKGHYQGNMIATGNVEITDSGRVTGNITTDSLVISKGGFFNGNVTKMNEHSTGQRPIYLMDDLRTPQLSGQR
jgi:cytoskeletal protein CcmA (bactofilin family)